VQECTEAAPRSCASFSFLSDRHPPPRHLILPLEMVDEFKKGKKVAEGALMPEKQDEVLKRLVGPSGPVDKYYVEGHCSKKRATLKDYN
jgi:hypothetical protein